MKGSGDKFNNQGKEENAVLIPEYIYWEKVTNMEEASKATEDEHFPLSPNKNYINHHPSSPAQVTHQTSDEKKYNRDSIALHEQSQQQCSDRRQQTTISNEEGRPERYSTRNHTRGGSHQLRDVRNTRDNYSPDRRRRHHSGRTYSQGRGSDTFYERSDLHNDRDTRRDTNNYYNNNINNSSRDRCMTGRPPFTERPVRHDDHRVCRNRNRRDCSDGFGDRRRARLPCDGRLDDHHKNDVPPCRFREQNYRSHSDNNHWHRQNEGFHRGYDQRDSSSHHARHGRKMNHCQTWDRPYNGQSSQRYHPYSRSGVPP